MGSKVKETSPLLHILIPAYGDSPFLEETLRSVADLNHLNKVKVTVVDDGSKSENIYAIVNSFKSLGFEYIKNDKNLGISENFHKCMSLSKGKFTLLLGSDDKIMPSAIEILELETSKNPNLDLIQFRTQIIDFNGKIDKPFVDMVKNFFTPRGVFKHSIVGEKLLRSLLLGNWTYFPAIVWKTDLIGNLNWDKRFKHAIDLALICDLAANGASMKVTNDIGVQYRRHSESESSKLALTTTRVTEELYVHKLLLKYFNGFKNFQMRILAEIAFSVRMHSLISALSHMTSDKNGSFSILKITFTRLNKINLFD